MLGTAELIEAIAAATRTEPAPTWLIAGYAVLGQRRIPRRPPDAYFGFYRCGKLLPAWPLDVLIHVARKIGGPHQLADRVEAEPELCRGSVAALLRELLLTDPGVVSYPDAARGDRIGQALAVLSPFMAIYRRLESEPTRRLTSLVELQRRAIDDAVAVARVSGEIIRFTPAVEPSPHTVLREKFWSRYFANIAAETGTPPVIPRTSPDTMAVTRRHLRYLHQLLSASSLGMQALGSGLGIFDRRFLATRPRGPAALHATPHRGYRRASADIREPLGLCQRCALAGRRELRAPNDC